MVWRTDAEQKHETKEQQGPSKVQGRQRQKDPEIEGKLHCNLNREG